MDTTPKKHQTEPQSHIHALCKTRDKAAWVKAAQSQGLKLTDWIIKTLNAASK
jgi:hypothetical protein